MVLCAAVLWWCHEASPTWMALRFFGKLKAFKVKAIALKYIKIIKISKKDTINFGCSSKAPRRLGSLSLRPWIRTSCSMEHLRSFGLSVANILLVYDTFMIPQYSCFDDNVRIFPPLFPKGQGLSQWSESRRCWSMIEHWWIVLDRGIGTSSTLFSTLKTGISPASRQWHGLRRNSKPHGSGPFQAKFSEVDQKSKLGVFVFFGLLLRRSIPWTQWMLYNPCAYCTTGKMVVWESYSQLRPLGLLRGSCSTKL